MAADLVLDLSATTSGLHECLDSIEESCAGRNIPRAMVARLRVVVEELLSNTIKHGYGGESQRPVRLRFCWSPRIELVYEDAAPPFDPTAWRPPGAAAPHGVIGQKGIALVLGLAASARYERLPDGNRVTLGFA
jgi:anti-sigma regulatory factor (Ser/Thr protein kinase)